MICPNLTKTKSCFGLVGEKLEQVLALKEVQDLCQVSHFVDYIPISNQDSLCMSIFLWCLWFILSFSKRSLKFSSCFQQKTKNPRLLWSVLFVVSEKKNMFRNFHNFVPSRVPPEINSVKPFDPGPCVAWDGFGFPKILDKPFSMDHKWSTWFSTKDGSP